MPICTFSLRKRCANGYKWVSRHPYVPICTPQKVVQMGQMGTNGPPKKCKWVPEGHLHLPFSWCANGSPRRGIWPPGRAICTPKWFTEDCNRLVTPYVFGNRGCKWAYGSNGCPGGPFDPYDTSVQMGQMGVQEGHFAHMTPVCKWVKWVSGIPICPYDPMANRRQCPLPTQNGTGGSSYSSSR